MSRKLLVGLLAVCLAVAGGTAGAKPLPAESQTVLKAGKAWVRVDQVGEAVAVFAAIDIAAAPQKIWPLLTDCGRAKKENPNLTVCRVVEKGPGFEVWEHVTKASMGVPGIRSVFRTDYTPHSRIVFRKAGGDLKVLQGEWRLEPLSDGKTRLIYESRFAIDHDFPPALVRAGIKSGTEKSFLKLRKEVSGK
ncbi:polyketide cyclase [Caulobacter sp. SLTY]|uniref:SRPBCC family protein n=1 Tax=Caulobacter sp. SLTY TaxID=2683262 RepID=UPI001413342B|nr:SRPBCC family protein [Caulobacter sp. SLTY]NBB16703.1 polyketide cyclase [Caulobacter sp. SLTY]